MKLSLNNSFILLTLILPMGTQAKANQCELALRGSQNQVELITPRSRKKKPFGREEAPADNTYPVLHNAFLANDMQTYSRLLNEAVLKSTKELDMLPLHYATLHNHEKIAKDLIALGADVNAPDKLGDTPLHNAVFSGNLSMVKNLIQWGANVEALNASGKSPLYYATLQEHHKIVKVLTKSGAGVSTINKNGETPLKAERQIE